MCYSKSKECMQNKEIQEAVDLLCDEHLVWSSDMNDIRVELANLIRVTQGVSLFRPYTLALVHKLLNGSEPATRFDDIERR